MVNIYQLALCKINGVGLAIAHKIIDTLGSAEALFNESPENLKLIFGSRDNIIRQIINKEMFSRCEKELEFINKYNIRSYFITDDDYPKRLKQIPDSPICLFVQGNGDFEAKRVVAVVGTRNATDYGRFITENIVAHLQELGCIVISGLAYGIDSYAHSACLKRNMTTFGIMGTGMDTVYPKAHFDLAQRMKENGGLITEYFTKTEPSAYNFPARNRIIAALSDLVIVVEAAKKGGALLTARLANDYNREVIAVPGRYGDKYSFGCNFLIESNRAHILSNYSSIDKIMGWEPEVKNESQTATTLFQNTASQEPIDKGQSLKGKEKLVYYTIKENTKMDIDSLIIKTKLNFSELSGILLNLELEDYIIVKPGKIYQVI